MEEALIKHKVLLFGITKEIAGHPAIEVALPSSATVKELLLFLQKKFPAFLKLKSLVVAVNGEYASEGQVIKELDEIALIPPVSGG